MLCSDPFSPGWEGTVLQRGTEARARGWDEETYTKGRGQTEAIKASQARLSRPACAAAALSGDRRSLLLEKRKQADALSGLDRCCLPAARRFPPSLRVSVCVCMCCNCIGFSPSQSAGAKSRVLWGGRGKRWNASTVTSSYVASLLSNFG